MIELNQVSRTFGGKLVLDGLSMTLESTGIVSLLAPNAMGKSTLLSIIAGLLEPTSGTMTYSAGESSSDVTLLLPGDKNLYMKNTARENVWYFAVLSGVEPAEIEGQERRVLEWFPELRGLWDKPVESLSYGQKRMVALAGSIAARSTYLLVDEAFEGLDVAHADQLVRVLCEVAAERSVLVSSHDLGRAAEVADQVMFLSGGKIVRGGALTTDQVRRTYHELFGGEDDD